MEDAGLVKVKALTAHLLTIKATARATIRTRPGSYAWPNLRREAEAAFARGELVLATITRLHARHAHDHATAPGIRTMRRWFTQGRWIRHPTHDSAQPAAA